MLAEMKRELAELKRQKAGGYPRDSREGLDGLFDDDFDANIYDDDRTSTPSQNVPGVVVVANQEVERPVAAAVNRNPKDHARLRKAKLRKRSCVH